VDAARLLLHAAAAGEGSSGASVLVFAAGAATRAVDAALRVVGPEGYRPGTVLERCARDARSASLVLGSEDRTRQAAADALLS
jgi:alkylation response protein AidB-like acyl-CoA dehydrogenase